jgi:hypothetical protein
MFVFFTDIIIFVTSHGGPGTFSLNPYMCEISSSHNSDYKDTVLCAAILHGLLDIYENTIYISGTCLYHQFPTPRDAYDIWKGH